MLSDWGQGGGLNAGLSFWAPLITTLVPLSSAGSSTATFTRATAATVQDWEGRVYPVLSGEVRFRGARREQNLVQTKSEDFSNAAWTKTTCTATATTLTATAGNGTCLQTQTLASASYVLRVKLSRITGTGNVQLTIDGISFTTVTLTGADQVFSLAQTGVTNPNYGIRIATNGDAINATQIALYSTTGKSNTNPPEYLSVGVLSAPFNGAGIDAVQYFPIQNGNTVASNLVTEAGGAAISSSTLLGYLSEQQSTNLVLQSENFGTTWAAVGTPTRVAANTRCGAVVLDLIGDDDAGVLEGYTQTIGFTGNAVKAVSWIFAQGTSASSVTRVRDTTAGADRLLCATTWSVGVPTVTMTTGTLLGVDTLGNSCFRARVLTTSVTAANTNSLQAYPATDAALSVANTGNINWGGVQAEDSSVGCTSYIPTTTATVTRNADVLKYPTSGNLSSTIGTCYAEVTSARSTGGVGIPTVAATYSGSGGILLAVADVSRNLGIYDDTAWRASTTVITLPATTAQKVVSTWNGTAGAAYLNGSGTATAALDGDLNLGANVALGNTVTGAGNELNGTVRNVKFWQIALTAGQVAAL